MKSFCLIIKFLIVFGSHGFLAMGDPTKGRESLSFATDDLIAGLDRWIGLDAELANQIDWAARHIREDLVGKFLCVDFAINFKDALNLSPDEAKVLEAVSWGEGDLDSLREAIQKLKDDLDYDSRGWPKDDSPRNSLYLKLLGLEDSVISSLDFRLSETGLMVSVDHASVVHDLNAAKKSDASDGLKITVDDDVRPVDKLLWFAYLQLFLGHRQSLSAISPPEDDIKDDFDFSDFKIDLITPESANLNMVDIERLMWMDAYWDGWLFISDSEITPLGKLILSSVDQISAKNPNARGQVLSGLTEIMFKIQISLSDRKYSEEDFLSSVSERLSRDLVFSDLNPDYIDMQSFVFKFYHFIFRPKLKNINELGPGIPHRRKFKRAIVEHILPSLNHLLQVRRYQKATPDQSSWSLMNDTILPRDVIDQLDEAFDSLLGSFKPETKEGREEKAEIVRIFKAYRKVKLDLIAARMIRDINFIYRSGFLGALDRAFLAVPPTYRTIRDSLRCLRFFIRKGRDGD